MPWITEKAELPEATRLGYLRLTGEAKTCRTVKKGGGARKGGSMWNLFQQAVHPEQHWNIAPEDKDAWICLLKNGSIKECFVSKWKIRLKIHFNCNLSLQ
jgi:hypothetical protein